MDKILTNLGPFKEISQNDNGTYMLTDTQFYAELEKRGLANSKEVLKAVRTAKQNFALDVFKALGEKVKETKEDQFLVAGTGDNRIEFGFLAQKEINIPAKEGEPMKHETRYGYCTYKEQHKIPDAWKKDNGELAKLASEIEQIMK